MTVIKNGNSVGYFQSRHNLNTTGKNIDRRKNPKYRSSNPRHGRLEERPDGIYIVFKDGQETLWKACHDRKEANS